MKTRMVGPALFTMMMAASAAQAQDTVQINFWEQDPPAVAAEIDKWIAVFQKENPKIKIVRQHYENEELRTKFLRSSVTGDGADIVYGPNDIAGVFATAGVVQPVDSFINPAQFSETSLGMTKLDGKIWGVPLSESSFLLMYYNKDLVKEAPKDTKELLTQAKAFTDAKQNKYGLAFFQSEPFWFATFQGGFGTWPLTQQGTSYKVTIDTPETTKALQYLVDLKDKEKVVPAECNYDCAKNLFLSGKTLFHFNGDWELNAYKEKFGDKLGIAPLPVISETGKPLTPMIGGRFLFVNASTKGPKLDAVKKFVTFVTSKMVQQRIALQLNSIPASLEARNDPKVKENATLTALINAAANAKPMPPQVEMRAAWDGMRIMVQRAMSGKETPAVAVKTGQKAANEALKAVQETPKSKSAAK
jgi:arabinogalactan oligomer/maltooligosaccharide transport system substrate-binding protein